MSDEFFQDLRFHPTPKKKKIDFESIKSYLTRQNILVFDVEHHVCWIIADAVGEVLLNGEKMEYDPFITNICLQAIRNGCTVVTQEKHNIRFKYDCSKYDLSPVICMSDLSSLRCGIMRVDGKRKLPNSKEIQKFIDKKKIDVDLSSACHCILNSFVVGRLNGWW